MLGAWALTFRKIGALWRWAPRTVLSPPAVPQEPWRLPTWPGLQVGCRHSTRLCHPGGKHSLGRAAQGGCVLPSAGSVV